MSTLHTTASRERAVDAAPADVHAYAHAVRRHLGGLSTDQVDDLTDGLEADLADALADRPGGGDDLLALFGPPKEYATELRTAAGFGEAPATRRRRSEAVRARLVALRERVLRPLRAQLWWPGAAGLAAELAPAWWVLRGYVLYRAVAGVLESHTTLLPYALAGWLLLVAALAASVQWGRGRWAGRRGLRVLAATAQAVAVVALIPVGYYLSQSIDGDGGMYAVYESPDEGVYVDGVPAKNLFVYDADGLPVPGALVYDQDGKPVSVGEGVYQFQGDQQWALVPAEDLDGTVRANVYPRAGVLNGWFEGDEVTGGTAVDLRSRSSRCPPCGRCHPRTPRPRPRARLPRWSPPQARPRARRL